MLITPFHFICHTEERLRTQMGALDPALDRFVEIQRRFNMEENFSLLQFGKKASLGEEFETYATFRATLVPQKENKVAFNCHFRCQDADMDLNFRILLRRVEEAEMQILKIVEMLQKAFTPLDYKSAAPIEDESSTFTPATKPGEPEDLDDISEEELAAILDTGDKKPSADSVDPNDPLAGMNMGGDEDTPKKKKYYVEDVHDGDTVQLKDSSGAYVPAGELPATLRINREAPTTKNTSASPTAESEAATAQEEEPAATVAQEPVEQEEPATETPEPAAESKATKDKKEISQEPEAQAQPAPEQTSEADDTNTASDEPSDPEDSPTKDKK